MRARVLFSIMQLMLQQLVWPQFARLQPFRESHGWIDAALRQSEKHSPAKRADQYH